MFKYLIRNRDFSFPAIVEFQSELSVEDYNSFYYERLIYIPSEFTDVCINWLIRDSYLTFRSNLNKTEGE